MCNPFLHHVHVELHIQYNILYDFIEMMLKEKLSPQFIYPAMTINVLLTLKNDLFPTYPYICAWKIYLFAVCD